MTFVRKIRTYNIDEIDGRGKCFEDVVSDQNFKEFFSPQMKSHIFG